MQEEEIIEEIEPETSDDSDRTVLIVGGIAAAAWLLSGLKLNFSPNIAPSLTGPSLTYKRENAPSLPPVQSPPPPPPPPTWERAAHPVLEPWPRKVTTHGGFRAARYVLKVGPFERSSGRPFYGRQAPHHLHQGIDLDAVEGEAVMAPDDGTAELADPGPLGAPGAVALRTAGDRRWVFVHVKPAGSFPRQVKAGEMIAQVGKGYSHLHVNLGISGVNVDPTPILSPT